jgi:hypothetical protein
MTSNPAVLRRAPQRTVTWLPIDALYAVALAIGMLAPLAPRVRVALRGRRQPVLSSRS